MIMWLRSIRPIKLFFFLLLLNFIVHSPFLTQPVIDTEADHYYTILTIAHNSFNFFTPTEEEKVPVMFIIPTFLTHAFPSLVWGRLQNLVAATIALVYVFLLGRKIHSSSAGLVAVVLSMFLPMFAVQSVFYTDAMPVTAAFLAVVYYFLANNKKGYLISTSVAVLTKETLSLMPVLLFAFAVFFESRSQVYKEKVKEKLFLLTPLLFFIIWTILNKIFFGYFFFPGNSQNIASGISTLDQALMNIWKYSIRLLRHGNTYFAVIPLFFLYPLYLLRNKALLVKDRKILLLFVLIIGVYLSFYGHFYYWGLRFVLFLYPLVFLFLAKVLCDFFSKREIFLIVCILCSSFVFSQWQTVHLPAHSITGEAIDIRYIAQRNLVTKVVKAIEPIGDHPIYTDYQMAHYLWNPLFGYVLNPYTNVFQINDEENIKECPHCLCESCVLPKEIPRGRKVYILACDAVSNPLCSKVSHQIDAMLADNGTLIESFVPDWPPYPIDKYNLFEYYKPND